MFKKNVTHLQEDLYSFMQTTSKSYRESIEASEERCFYKLIFCQIPEDLFSSLYSDEKSRPNAPINAMVSALILQNHYAWTYEELFKHIRFNVLTKTALGLKQLEDMPFCMATLFNFQNRINTHFVTTGENLLDQVFDRLTKDQLKQLKIKTNIQRCDSFSAASNIRSYSRLQLLVEMILRIYRVLSEADQELMKTMCDAYLRKKSSGQYIYSIKSSDLPKELEKIGEVMAWIDNELKPRYAEVDIFSVFERVFEEHFRKVAERLEVKTAEDLTSDCAQSPDDLDATYRKKNGKAYKGQVINVVETAHPDNMLNLLTDVSVHANNVDDSVILEERLETLKEKTPELDELHTDGAYAGSETDRKMNDLEVRHVVTGVRGVEREVKMEIIAPKENNQIYQVCCPTQTVSSQATKTRYKACFDATICGRCEHRERCAAIKQKEHYVFYFTKEDFARQERIRMIMELPPERRKIRNNVEATVHEFVCRMRNHKLKVRGTFRAILFAVTTAIGINFGRIYRYILYKGNLFDYLGTKIFLSLNIFLENRICVYSLNFFQPQGMKKAA